MPIYEYKCSDCGHFFEKLIRNQADLPSVCPECGEDALRKQFSVFSASAGSPKASACESGACDAAGQCPASRQCAGGKCPF